MNDIEFLWRTVYDTFAPEWAEEPAQWPTKFLLYLLGLITFGIWVVVLA